MRRALASLAAACLAAACGAGEEPVGSGVWLEDLAGRRVDPLAESERSQARVFTFVLPDCPISNRYAPELRRLHAEFSDRVRFFLVYPDPDVDAAEIERHQEEYALPMEALRDPEHALVGLAGASVTPETAVFTSAAEGGWRMTYRGRIDDRFLDFGKARAEPTRRDLEGALRAALEGRPLPEARTRAVGCYIADLQP